ncbi:MAG: zf-HC2 domain-containing protein [Ignavibacteriales bacterium]|nr:zf-HC2 domain-containing protein [Ignavibacteriales bacterium]
MKQHSHIRSLLLPWIELRLNARDQQLVESHLKECPSCRAYFERLSAALLPAQEVPRNTLAADPFLPTRIRAMVDSSKQPSREVKAVVVRWTLMSAMFVAAVLCGAYLGEALSYRTSTVTEQNVITEYSESLEVGGIADRLQSIAQSSTEAAK